MTTSVQQDLINALGELAEGEQRWAMAGLRTRARLLGEVHATMAEQSDAWVAAACRAKWLDPTSRLAGEEWLSGPYAILTALDRLRRSLLDLSQGISPIADLTLGVAPGGRTSIPVMPTARFDRLLLHGFRADVWSRPGIGADRIRADAGLAARAPGRTAGIGLVLGAGNVSCIGPLDALSELIAHNRVALLKLNPTLDALLEPMTLAFAPLIDLGVLRIVTGGAEVGEFLVGHPDVAHVHITGSVATHDRIVWGTGEDAIERRRAGKPLLDKPISSELGGVSPIMVIPGRWSAADLKFQAEHIATQRLNNGGYNCIAGQLVMVSSDWPQRAAFLQALRTALDRAPRRPAWYPGSDDRMAQARERYPTAEALGDGSRLLIDLTGRGDRAAAETTEYFAPVLAVIDLPGTGQAFLDRAVETANNDLAGTLGANIIASPKTLAQLGDGLLDAVARLRYGTIAVNAWTAVGFLTPGAGWGAFPGHTLFDVQSGIGVVHNGFLLDHVERTVVRGPFRPAPRSLLHGEFALSPKPLWFVSARTGRQTATRLTRFAARPSWRALPGLLASALRG
ncbi:aldehyde dehydrogenase family protein [Nakamurella lactea]|uniref:aldehyde dehydrogenase family protein n=1 Tax=Nakamurella lactea TaxID=459515 RepID=UPI00048C3185|nr:aldehyde dehydrogenase family protein [Nakamurella lactea]